MEKEKKKKKKEIPTLVTPPLMTPPLMLEQGGYPSGCFWGVLGFRWT